VERLLDVRALFDSHDTDGSGSIGIEEVEVVLGQLGFTPTPEQLCRLFEVMDVDGSGEVGYREFATAIMEPGTGSSAVSLSPAARERLFNFFDDDGSGSIDEVEMLAKLGELGFDQDGVSNLFIEMGGLNSSGKQRETVSRKQFLRYLERAEAEDA